MGFKAYTLKELDGIVAAEMAKWLESRRIGVAEYVPEENLIKIDVSEDVVPYPVDLKYLKTSNELLNMVFHISEKSWCKGSVLTDFIQCLTWVIREREDQTLWEFFLYK